jgi:hypothetical protein
MTSFDTMSTNLILFSPLKASRKETPSGSTEYQKFLYANRDGTPRRSAKSEPMTIPGIG